MVKIRGILHLLLLLLIGGMTFDISAKTGKNVDDPILKIEASMDDSGFEGETMVYEVKLYSTSPDVSNVKIMNAPVFPAGCRVINGVLGNSKPTVEKRDGKEFYSWVIMRNYLTPYQIGKQRVSASKFVVFIPRETIVYHSFFGSRSVVEYDENIVKCEPVEFKIKELPKNKTHKTYNDCVGDFKVEGWFPPGNISVGMDAYAVFTISGYGSLKSLRITNLSGVFGDGCHLKKVDQDDQLMQRDGRLYSEVTLTCLFVPDKEDFKIKPFELTFFNPTTQKYYTVKSEELHWTTTPRNSLEKRQNEAITI